MQRCKIIGFTSKRWLITPSGTVQRRVSAVCCPSKGQCILSGILPSPSRYLNAIAAAKNLLCKVASAPVSQISKKELVYVAKASAVSSVNRVTVRLCVGQDRSPVSSGHRKEVQSPISPT
jgi:hypothetical protein